MKKPYLSKLKEVDGFKIFIVDGNYIRKNINEEFTNFGQHYRFKFIPKNEFWLDREVSTGEENFYINHLIVEFSLMSKGIPYEKAIVKADFVEKKERKKSKYYLDVKKASKKKCLDEIHKKLWKAYSNEKFKVWIVNGEAVRDLYFIDFTEGGHEYVYSFVPKGEVWIDDDLSVKERKFVLLHEIHERNLMAKGMEYHHAHHSSSVIEYICRNNTSKLKKYLEKEFKIMDK